jgi:hypothetical protein
LPKDSLVCASVVEGGTKAAPKEVSMKTQSTVALSMAAGAMLLAASCSDVDHTVHPNPDTVEGNGIVVEESRTVGGFDRITLQGFGRVYVRQGSQESLRIRAEENLIQHLRTEVRGDELVIWKDGVTLKNTAPIEFHVTVADLRSTALTGAGNIEVSNLDTGPLDLRLTGVGNLEITGLNASRLDVEITGVGDVIVSGSAGEQTVRLRSLGDYDGTDLMSSEAQVLIADSGSATVRVQDRLQATINGSGDVYYIGAPTVESRITGSGEVINVGE